MIISSKEKFMILSECEIINLKFALEMLLEKEKDSMKFYKLLEEQLLTNLYDEIREVLKESDKYDY